MYILLAPSAPPISVSTSNVTSSNITVHWRPVDCIHHNGDIIGYSVQYGVEGSESNRNMNISGDATTQTTLSGLKPSTNYSIEVAAVNIAGPGVYSVDISSITLGEKLLKYVT